MSGVQIVRFGCRRQAIEGGKGIKVGELLLLSFRKGTAVGVPELPRERTRGDQTRGDQIMWTELVDVAGLLLWVMVFGIDLLPTLVAGLQQHNQFYLIAGVNLLLGWTILGWIGALVLVLKPEEPLPNKKKNHRREEEPSQEISDANAARPSRRRSGAPARPARSTPGGLGPVMARWALVGKS